MGRVAKIQSVEMDTTATAYDSTVWILRPLHSPSIVGYQFFLFLELVMGTLEGEGREDVLYWPTLEEEIHSRPAHDDETGYHAGVDDHLDPFLAVRNADQGEADAALDRDESEAPWLLEDVKPLLLVSISSRTTERRMRSMVTYLQGHGILRRGQRAIILSNATPSHTECSNCAHRPDRLASRQ